MDSDSGSKSNGSEFSPPRPIKAHCNAPRCVYTGNHELHSTCTLYVIVRSTYMVLCIPSVSCGVAEFVATKRREKNPVD